MDEALYEIDDIQEELQEIIRRGNETQERKRIKELGNILTAKLDRLERENRLLEKMIQGLFKLF